MIGSDFLRGSMTVAARGMAGLALVLFAAAGTLRAEDKGAPDDASARSWHGPAALAAEAAAAKSAEADGNGTSPPAPVPAKRPASQAKPPEEKPAAGKEATVTPVPLGPKAAGGAEGPASAGAKAKDAKSKDAKPPPPKKPQLSARQLFGSVATPAKLASRSLGWYAKGCLSGGKALSVNGPAWQVMRLSRNRNWGHPNLVALIEKLARESKAAGEWPGLLVGDMSQPRGGPMISGHASHQVGLDADIWLTPMPDHTLTKREREDLSATSMLANYSAVNPTVFGEGQVKLIKRAASYAEVERIFVHPAIKKALCEASGTDRAWLSKVRPMYGHYYHFHIRMSCPKGQANCQHQPAVPGGDGCGDELKDWLKLVAPKPKPKPAPPVEAEKKPSKPRPKKPEITLADLPPACKAVLTAGGNVPPTEPAALVDNSKDAGPANDTTQTAMPEPSSPPAAVPTAARATTSAATNR